MWVIEDESVTSSMIYRVKSSKMYQVKSDQHKEQGIIKRLSKQSPSSDGECFCIDHMRSLFRVAIKWECFTFVEVIVTFRAAKWFSYVNSVIL